MPELPEVETIRRQLADTLVGAELLGVMVRRASCYAGSREVAGEKVAKVRRSGKYLFIYFKSGRGLVVHLKMTGRLVLNSQILTLDYETAKHTRVVIQLQDGRKLYYWDSRTFGYVKHVERVADEQRKTQRNLGPEPWELRVEQFFALCQKYGRPIKNLILDQKLLAGVGNIYANDGLWEAGVDPRRAANSLTRGEAARLREKLCYVMERGLITGGASDNSYVDALGARGRYQDEFRVYRRAGEPCLKCGQKLRRVVVGGRGTWLCVVCQK